MKFSKALFASVAVAVVFSFAGASKAHAFDWQFEDGGVPVSVEAEPFFCKTDTECPYGQQCNTATGACYTPSSATSCACAPDSDPCTDDSGVVLDFGGCFCPHTRLNTPECSLVKKVGALTPTNPIEIGKTPTDPGTDTPDPVTPVDPTSPTPVTSDPDPTATPPVVEGPSDDACAKMPLAYQTCCRDVKGDLFRVMTECVHDETRASDCSNIASSVTNLGHMSQCCIVLRGSSSITSAKGIEACDDTFADTGAPTGSGPSSSAGETASSDPHKTLTFGPDASAADSGCSLETNASSSQGFGSALVGLAGLTVVLLLTAKKERIGDDLAAK